MHAAWLICAKDLKARLRDRSALLIGIVVPLALAFIFNVIFSGISGSSGVINLGVVDADHGAASQAFTQQVLPAVKSSGLITIHTEATADRARALAASAGLSTFRAMCRFSLRFSASKTKPMPPTPSSSRTR